MLHLVALSIPLSRESMTIAGSTEYYLQLLDEAKAYARLQGFKGARWFKMRGAQTLTVFTGPSAVGPLLLQEQPHPIVVSDPSPRPVGCRPHCLSRLSLSVVCGASLPSRIDGCRTLCHAREVRRPCSSHV